MTVAQSFFVVFFSAIIYTASPAKYARADEINCYDRRVYETAGSDLATCTRKAVEGDVNLQVAMCISTQASIWWKVYNKIFEQYLMPTCKALAVGSDAEKSENLQRVRGSAAIILSGIYRKKYGSGGDTDYAPGVAQDYIEAFRWCRIGDEAGSEGALECMFDAYYTGNGTGRDLVESYKYINLQIEHEGALRLGQISNPEAAIFDISKLKHKQRREIESALTIQQILEAERRAWEWNWKHKYTTLAPLR